MCWWTGSHILLFSSLGVQIPTVNPGGWRKTILSPERQFYGYLCFGVLWRPDIKWTLRLWAALAPDGWGEVSVPSPSSQEYLPAKMPALTFTAGNSLRTPLLLECYDFTWLLLIKGKIFLLSSYLSWGVKCLVPVLIVSTAWPVWNTSQTDLGRI